MSATELEWPSERLWDSSCFLWLRFFLLTFHCLLCQYLHWQCWSWFTLAYGVTGTPLTLASPQLDFSPNQMSFQGISRGGKQPQSLEKHTLFFTRLAQINIKNQVLISTHILSIHSYHPFFVKQHPTNPANQSHPAVKSAAGRSEVQGLPETPPAPGASWIIPTN